MEYILKKKEFEQKYPDADRESDSFSGMGGLVIDTLFYKMEIEDALKDVTTFTQKNDLRNLTRSYFSLGVFSMGK